jgi:hypothetical protein
MDVSVTFLEAPRIGFPVQISHNGQVGPTAVVTLVEVDPTRANYYRVTTQVGAVCVGYGPPLPPLPIVQAPQRGNSFTSGLGLGAGFPCGCVMGCVGLALVPLVILLIIAGMASR